MYCALNMIMLCQKLSMFWKITELRIMGMLPPIEYCKTLCEHYDFVHHGKHIYKIMELNVAVWFIFQDTYVSGEAVSVKVLHTHYHVLGTQEMDCIRKLNMADPEGFSPTIRLQVT